MQPDTIITDWYAEGQSARRDAVSKGVVNNTDLLRIARHEYHLLLKAVGRREGVDTYRQYIRGFYNPTRGEDQNKPSKSSPTLPFEW